MVKHPEHKWIEVATGGANNRNKLIEITKYKKPPLKDCYRTIFRFNDALMIHHKETGSVKGFRGIAYADWLPFDIDDSDISKAHGQARQLLQRLEARYDVDVKQLYCFFSGSKGFHILIPEPLIGLYPTTRLPQAFKSMAQEIMQGLSYDGSIYEHLRIFRVNNTVNSKSGLYKIPLTASELLHIETAQILAMAKAPRTVEFYPVSEMELSESLSELFVQVMRVDKQPDILVPTVQLIPRDAKLCYYALLNGVTEGERDNAAIRLATHFKKQGYQANITFGILQAWNKKNNPPIAVTQMEKFIHQAYEGVYDYGCKDHLLAQYCDRKCHLQRRKLERVKADNIYSVADARKKYEEYIADLETRKIKLGIHKLDKRLRGIAPGEVMQIMARSSVGKTAVLLNIMKNVSEKQDTPVLFFSLEMPIAQIYERMVQISGRHDGEEVEQAFHTKKPEISTMARMADKAYNNVLTVDQDFLTLDELKEYTELAEQKIGKRIGLICVDYLGRMKGNTTKEYDLVSELSRQLKNLAKETDKAVIYLHQTSREGGTGTEPVTMNMGRGSGVGEEAADHIIGMWRPSMDDIEAQKSDTEPIILAVLKGRKGPKCSHEMCLQKRKLRLTEYELLDNAKTVPYKKEELPFKGGASNDVGSGGKD